MFFLRRLTAYVFLLLTVFIFVPQVTFAQTEGTTSIPNCYCFCEGKEGTVFLDKNGNQAMTEEKKGVLDIDKQHMVAPKTCEASCAKLGEGAKVAVCAATFAQFPTNNRLCFTKTQCERKNVNGTPLGVWDGNKLNKKQLQPPECLKGMYYCYPHAEKAVTKLSVKIGNVETADDFGSYVMIIYQWLLGAGAVIAVVMVLVGGFQWVLAARSGNIAEAKKRIMNGVIGLMLLLSVAFLFTVVNPQTLTMQVPRLPLIRTLEIPGADSCEKLIGNGTIVKPEQDGEVDCGKMGLIIKAADGVDFVPGSTCQYHGCPTNEAAVPEEGFSGNIDYTQCVGFGASAECTTCKELIDTSKIGGVKPSSEICGKFDRGATYTGADGHIFERCIWTKDGDFTSEKGIIKADNPGSCVYMNIDCRKIKKCFDYTNTGVVVLNAESSGVKALNALDTEPNCSNALLGELESLTGSCSNHSLRSICVENPCGVESITGCKLEEDGVDHCTTNN